MTDRLLIEITGPLPDANKHRRVVDAEDAVNAFVKVWNKNHADVPLTATVRLLGPPRGRSVVSGDIGQASTLESVPSAPPFVHPSTQMYIGQRYDELRRAAGD